MLRTTNVSYFMFQFAAYIKFSFKIKLRLHIKLH